MTMNCLIQKQIALAVMCPLTKNEPNHILVNGCHEIRETVGKSGTSHQAIH